MNFNIQRHIRLAGTVVVILGLVLQNSSLIALGWLAVLIGYMHAIHKIERILEELGKEK